MFKVTTCNVSGIGEEKASNKANFIRISSPDFSQLILLSSIPRVLMASGCTLSVREIHASDKRPCRQVSWILPVASKSKFYTLSMASNSVV